MKKACLFTIVLLATLSAVAQKSGKSNTKALSNGAYECIYEYHVKGEGGAVDTYSTILQIGNNVARFTDYTAFKVDSARSAVNVNPDEIEKLSLQNVKNDFSFDQTVFQNHPKGKITVCSVIGTDYYNYQEKAYSTNWKLTEQDSTVCGYKCKKATGSYGGRTWTVWYAPEIAVPFGPWKLCGLPGLVLSAADSEGLHKFEAIIFRKSSTIIPAPDVRKTVSTTRDKFIKTKNVFEENPMSNIPIESLNEINVLKTDNGNKVIMMNGVRVRTHPNGYVPLEKE